MPQAAAAPSPELELAPHLEALRNSIDWLHQSASMRQAVKFYRDVLQHPACQREYVAELGRRDRFFLLTHLLHRADAVHPWLYDRCREVEANPDDRLDLWARDHYKSTIITFTGVIQEILRDPEITVGIFSHVRPIAKKFLGQIAVELERNEDLKRTYPDVLYQHPRKESPSWSVENGIVVRRLTNPKEKTVEAWGLVDGQPTGAHFGLGVFDDVVTRKSVNTPDQIVKTTEAWELAQNLLSSHRRRRWMIGTRYLYADTYEQILSRGAVEARIYPATDDGTFDGAPVFLRPEVWEQKKRDESLATIACQQLQNPQAGNQQKFKLEWLRPYEVRPFTLNVYIMGDYAGAKPNAGAGSSSKSSKSSNTAFIVIGVDHGLNKYLLDGAVHRMTLSERWIMLRNLRKKWLAAPGVQVVEVGYERYGAQSDIEHFEQMMQIEGEAFAIEELAWPRDGSVSKDIRIERLEPDLRNWRFFFPYDPDRVKRELIAKGKPVPADIDGYTSMQRKATANKQEFLIARPIKQKNEDGRIYNVLDYIINNEYTFFPNTTKKDGLDAMSRIYDMNICAPMQYSESDLTPPADND